MKSYLYLLLILLVSALMAAPAQGQKGEREGRTRTKKNQKRQREKAINLENLPTAFALSWQFASDGTTRLPVLAENDSVYLPLNDGRVVALDAKSGELQWETQPGGVIAAPIAATSELLFVASRQGT